MIASTTQDLLVLEANCRRESGQWRFSLRNNDGSRGFEATDVEPNVRGDRLDLLTVVRALESLDQPSRVTLLGCSQYVWQGMHYGLAEWRENGWCWEFFGQMVPVKNGDLWQRLDRALQYHDVQCRQRRFDAPHVGFAEPRGQHRENNHNQNIRIEQHNRLKYFRALLPGGLRQRIASTVKMCLKRTAGTWTKSAGTKIRKTLQGGVCADYLGTG
jgi:ribonuclease HI